MNQKKIVFVALLVFVAIAIVVVAVYLLDSPEDNIPEDLQEYVPPVKDEESKQETGGLQVSQDPSAGKYGEMKGPN